jgi:hypothetical protein
VKVSPGVLQAGTRICSSIRRLTTGDDLDFFGLRLAEAAQFLRQVRIIARKHNAQFT